MFSPLLLSSVLRHHVSDTVNLGFVCGKTLIFDIGIIIMKPQVKHKFCRRIGSCLWGDATCPSVKRPYGAGSHGANKRRGKMSTYGELLLEKQKLKNYYAISEKQLRLAYAKAKKGTGRTTEKLIQILELRLDTLVFHTGLAPSIFAAKQAVNHGHILVDGKKLDRNSAQVKAGSVISINAEKSPAIADLAKRTDARLPGYVEVDKENCKATLVRIPTEDDVNTVADIMKVIEYYAR